MVEQHNRRSAPKNSAGAQLQLNLPGEFMFANGRKLPQVPSQQAKCPTLSTFVSVITNYQTSISMNVNIPATTCKFNMSFDRHIYVKSNMKILQQHAATIRHQLNNANQIITNHFTASHVLLAILQPVPPAQPVSIRQQMVPFLKQLGRCPLVFS